MKRKLSLICLVAVSYWSHSQTTWADHAAEVFYNNCTQCHNPDGIGPMSLMTYADAVTYSPLVLTNVVNDIMPPWKPDSSYMHYSGERFLTQNEKNIIINWINEGTQSGDLGQAPPPPVYNGDQVLPGTPDLTVSAPNYMSKADTHDDYVCFVVPSGLLSGKKVKAMEVIPGNREIVHHCLVYYDVSGGATSDTIGGDCAGPVTSTLMGGYTPGSSPMIFPSTANFSSGMDLPANCDIIFAMHYPAGSYGMWDNQTKVNFYFYQEPVVNFREVSCDPIIQDWSFTITANTIDSVAASAGPMPNNYTVLSVLPHMHLLGAYIETWAVTPGNDTINFCKIPLWDFDWQDIYWFQYMRKVPIGSTVYAKAIWNNTVTNPHNPNDPPIDVSAGLNTTDEMFLVYFHYMEYQTGDEFIDIDSITTEYLSTVEIPQKHEFAKVYPNPFDLKTDIYYYLEENAFVSVYIYDMQGRMIKKLIHEEQQMGSHQVSWNGTNDDAMQVESGVYFYSMSVDGVNYSGRVIKR